MTKKKKLSIEFNGVFIDEYLEALAGLDRGIGSSNNVELQKTGYLGKLFKRATRDEKTIPMPFRLKYNLIEKRRILAGILNVSEPKPLIFGDEPNKVYYAIPTGDINVAETEFVGTGTITWLVPDSIAHEKTLTAVQAKLNSDGVLSMEVQYDGTEETPLEITFHNNAETGFLSAIGMHEDENTFITQLGYVDEADGETREKMQAIYTKDGGVFTKWTNASIFYENLNKYITGTMPTTTASGGWLGGVPSNATNPQNKQWYGTCKELVLPTAIENPYLWGRAWFETGKMGQTGQWTIAFVDENNVFVAGMALAKNDKVGNSANVHFLANDGNGTRIYKSIVFTPSYWVDSNPYGSQARETNRNMFDLKKEEDKITFYWYGQYFPFIIPFLKGKKVKKIQFYTGQYAGRTIAQLVTFMGIRDVTIIDLKSQYWQDLPNRFSAGSEVIVTKENGMHTIYRDGIKTLEDLITGSDFPVLKPGKNYIEFGYSDFTKEAPKITGIYEKRWL